LIDCHSDLMIDVFRRRRQGEHAVLARVHLPALARGGVAACVCTVGGDVPSLCPLGIDEPYGSAVAMLAELHADVAEADGEIAVVASAAEISRCLDEGILAILPALEGAMPFRGDLGLVEDLYDRGIRVVGLTWNSRNELAVGVGAGEGGLTPAGIRSVALMNELGMLVDLAHASPTTFWDVVRETAAPVYVSHANARAVWEHPRNLDDEQLKTIATTRGAVGVVFFPNFVGTHPVTLEHVLVQLEYLAAQVGYDSIVIGPDFVDFAIDEMLSDLGAHRDLYDEESLRFPAGLETVASMQNLIAALPSHGFDDVGVGKLARSNFLRVLEETEAVAGR